jgi:hypothetical protein
MNIISRRTTSGRISHVIVTEEITGWGAKSAKDNNVAGVSEKWARRAGFSLLMGVAAELVAVLGSFR